jgi:hypothetical protein
MADSCQNKLTINACACLLHYMLVADRYTYTVLHQVLREGGCIQSWSGPLGDCDWQIASEGSIV